MIVARGFLCTGVQMSTGNTRVAGRNAGKRFDVLQVAHTSGGK